MGNLILNVDGCIACCFVDMLRSSGAFPHEEITELVENGCLNGLFVLARSCGFIGHYLDQRRLKQPLYRPHGMTLLTCRQKPRLSMLSSRLEQALMPFPPIFPT